MKRLVFKCKETGQTINVVHCEDEHIDLVVDKMTRKQVIVTKDAVYKDVDIEKPIKLKRDGEIIEEVQIVTEKQLVSPAEKETIILDDVEVKDVIFDKVIVSAQENGRPSFIYFSELVDGDLEDYVENEKYAVVEKSWIEENAAELNAKNITIEKGKVKFTTDFVPEGE